MERLTIGDLLLIAEAVLGVPAESLVGATRLGSAASALVAPFAVDKRGDRYPTLGEKAGILCSRLVRTRPLPDGNKRVALIAMLELVERNHGVWVESNQDSLASAIERLADRRLSERTFVACVRRHVGTR